MFSMNSANSVTKIFVIREIEWKGLNLPPLVLETRMLNHSASKTRVRDRIFKLTPIHASVIYQIPRNR